MAKKTKKATTPNTSTTSATSTNNRHLSLADLKRGGDAGIKEKELPLLEKDGAPGIIYHKPISTAVVIELLDLKDQAEGDEENPEAQREMISLMTSIAYDSVVTEDGQPMFASRDEVTSIPPDVLGEIVKAVTSVIESEVQGNVSSGTEPSASSTS